VDYDPVFTTGHYFSETIKNLGTAQGLIRPVLSLFGLHEDASRDELLLKILGPYMRAKNLGTLNIPSAGAWKQKILDGTTHCFKMGMMPHMGVSGNGLNASSNPCGVETVLGMDVVWLIISQVTPPLSLPVWSPSAILTLPLPPTGAVCKRLAGPER